MVVRAKIFIQSTWLKGSGTLHCLPSIRPTGGLFSTSYQTWPTFGYLDGFIARHRDCGGTRVRGRIRARLHCRGVPEDKRRSSYEWMNKFGNGVIKQISLPRLVLNMTALLIGLMVHLRETLGLTDKTPYKTFDSMVTLGWIRGHPRWTTYVANRVSAIQTALPGVHWCHVSGQNNSADCASHGIASAELESHPLWWRRPR